MKQSWGIFQIQGQYVEKHKYMGTIRSGVIDEDKMQEC